MSKKDDAEIQARYPTVQAREAADRVIEGMDPTLPMTAFIDAWIDVYLKAGGRTP